MVEAALAKMERIMALSVFLTRLGLSRSNSASKQQAVCRGRRSLGLETRATLSINSKATTLVEQVVGGGVYYDVILEGKPVSR